MPLKSGEDVSENSQGENTCLEFKSSLRWSFKESNVDKRLEDVILKSLAAFNNGEGGTLLIGVSDEGDILGLDYDYRTLKDGHGDKDNFELHLRNLINKTYGIEFATNNVTISFFQTNGKEICRIDVKKGHKPLYTTIKNKNGQQLEKFYVRSGNSSQEISKASEITSYIQSRFESKNEDHSKHWFLSESTKNAWKFLFSIGGKKWRLQFIVFILPFCIVILHIAGYIEDWFRPILSTQSPVGTPLVTSITPMPIKTDQPVLAVPCSAQQARHYYVIIRPVQIKYRHYAACLNSMSWYSNQCSYS